MQPYVSSVQTPSGTYNVLTSTTTYRMYPGWDYNGKERYSHHRYCLGIGVVAETFAIYVASPYITERRLVRYKVQ